MDFRVFTKLIAALTITGFIYSSPFALTAKASDSTLNISNSSSTTEKQSTLFNNLKFSESNTLTDSLMKAQDGSLSRYSMKGSFSYYGPVLGDLSAPDQPNPDGSVGNYSQAFKGSISARYRLDSDTALSAGTGISIIRPFHGWDRTDVNNPFLSYDKAIRKGNTQFRTSPGIVIATVPEYTRTGEVGGLKWDNSMLVNMGTSRFNFSLDSSVSWWIYNRSYRPGSTKEGGDGKAQEYSLSLYPGFKYTFSDEINIFTSYALQYFNPRLLSDKSALWLRSPSARLGFSYSAGRSMYISPYLNTYPSVPFSKGTTFNMSIGFSLL